VQVAIKDIYEAVLSFNDSGVAALVQAEINAGSNVDQILNNGLIAAMDEVGRRFSEGELFVPEMLMAANAMKAGMGLLRPLLSSNHIQTKGTILIGTVKGDLHDIGKNIVAMMLEGAGFKVVNMGVDVEPQKFMAAVQNEKANIVALSALLTTTMPAMAETVAALKSGGLAVKTMIGGAPVTQDFADNIGADGYSPDAPGAVVLARKLLG
jgi:5-methyltetrahydrofolate--homocysteine methyltransferase